MRLVKAALLCTAATLAPTIADAAAAGAFFLGLTGQGLTGALALSGGLAAQAYLAGSFLGGGILGNILLQAAASYLLRPKPQRPPDIESAQINSRVDAPDRFQLGGRVAAGGAAGIFAEFDEDGNFWYIVAHGDSELIGDPSYILDGISVTLSDGTDGFTAGDVLTDDFCLDSDGNSFEGSGTRVPYFRMYTVTPDASNVYGALPSDFTTAFSGLPSDFRLAGVCYSIVRVASVRTEDRYKVFKWRGAIGLGEPSVTILGDFSRVYDPRNGAHDIDDSTTWTSSDSNPALLWAWWRTNQFGRNRGMSEVNWDKVSEAATTCEEQVLNRAAEYVDRYRCGVAAADSSSRFDVESEILKTFDAFVDYDDEGRAYPVAGAYSVPSLTMNGSRDVMSSQTEIVDDGENPVDGVVVRYISPLHGYTKQECAPWVNTDFYVSGRPPNYQFVDVLGCQDHNQAFRLAAAIGPRIAPSKRAALQCNVKGILAKGRRAIDLNLDSDFTGVHEIVTPVDEDEAGMSTAFAVVPLASDRWDGSGQSEGAPPEIAPNLNIDDTLEAASNVVITSEQVETETGAAVRFEVTFDAPTRVDRAYQFRYAKDGTTEYEYFFVDMDESRGYSAVVADGQAYDIQWQTITAGGRASGWAADVGGGETVYEITAVANSTPPGDLTAASATGAVGQVDLTWTTANDANQFAVEIYRNTVDTYGSATLVTTIVSGANVSGSYSDTGLAIGSYYYWLTPINGSGVQGNESGSYSATVT